MNRGNTPVPAAVRAAEQGVLSTQTSKSYVGPAGNVDFNERIIGLALGPLAAGLAGRTATIQTVGGCGALRLGAELVKVARPGTVVHVSDPTWANHEPLIGSSGLPLERYPYFDAARRACQLRRHARPHRSVARDFVGAVACVLPQPDRRRPDARAMDRTRGNY